MASKYRFGVYNYGLREWRKTSHYDFFTSATPARGIVAIFSTREDAQADADARNPKHDPLPGASGYPMYDVCDLNEESTYLTGQNVGKSGTNVVPRGKAEIVKQFVEKPS